MAVPIRTVIGQGLWYALNEPQQLPPLRTQCCPVSCCTVLTAAVGQGKCSFDGSPGAPGIKGRGNCAYANFTIKLQNKVSGIPLLNNNSQAVCFVGVA